MQKKFFENLGKDIDGMLKEGESLFKEVSKEVQKEFTEENINKKKDEVSSFIKELDTEFSKIFEDLKNEMNTTSTSAKFKIYKIKISDFESAKIKYIKNKNIITIGKKGVDTTFEINLVEDIPKKAVNKILNSVSFDKDSSILTLIVKTKHIKDMD